MTGAKKLSDQYLALLRQFPLKPIRTEKEHHAALEIMRELGYKGSSRTSEESDYLGVLSGVIADYEKRLPDPRQPMTPSEALAYLMGENHLSQADVATIVGGHQSQISAFLSGRRGLSKAQAEKLAEHFRVSVDLFLA